MMKSEDTGTAVDEWLKAQVAKPDVDTPFHQGRSPYEIWSFDKFEEGIQLPQCDLPEVFDEERRKCDMIDLRSQYFDTRHEANVPAALYSVAEKVFKDMLVSKCDAYRALYAFEEMNEDPFRAGCDADDVLTLLSYTMQSEWTFNKQESMLILSCHDMVDAAKGLAKAEKKQWLHMRMLSALLKLEMQPHDDVWSLNRELDAQKDTLIAAGIAVLRFCFPDPIISE
jgi:hypothetical protein